MRHKAAALLADAVLRDEALREDAAGAAPGAATWMWVGAMPWRSAAPSRWTPNSTTKLDRSDIMTFIEFL